MSVTSRLTFQRSNATQPASNLYGAAAAAISGRPGAQAAPTSTGGVQGSTALVGGGATFTQIVIGMAVLAAAWWAITWALERLLPLKDTPHFLTEFLHGFKLALVIAFWFILWKMSAGVAPFNRSEPYRTIALSV